MVDTFKRVWQSVTRFWGDLSGAQQTTYAMLVAVMGFLLIWGVVTTTGDGWVRLISVDDRDVAEDVRKRLDKMKEKYEVRPGGIYVRQERHAQLVLQVASEATGEKWIYDFLKESSLTISRYQFQQQLLVAHQNKLARMIGQMDKIRRVSIKITEQSKKGVMGFRGPPATAAVTLKLRSGTTFTMGNTVTIANIVAASVEGMKPEHVKVMDTEGRLYRVPPKDSAWWWATTRNEAEVSIENRLKNNVLGLWPNAKVGIRVKLSNKTQKVSERKFDEEGRDHKFRKQDESRAGTRGGSPPGIKGAGDAVRMIGSLMTDTQSNQTLDIESKFGTVETITDIPPGELESSSITVLFPVTEEQGIPADPQKTERKELIHGATGIEQDNIKVGFVVAAAPAPIEPLGYGIAEFMNEWGEMIFFAAVIFGALFILFYMVKKTVGRDVMDDLKDMQKELEAESAAPEAISAQDQDTARMKMTLRDMVTRNPIGVANVLRRWIVGR